MAIRQEIGYSFANIHRLIGVEYIVVHTLFFLFANIQPL
jgi:hypothetical protein